MEYTPIRFDELSDEQLDKRYGDAVRIAEEETKAMGIPLVRYDRELGKAYFLYSDGRREYEE